MLKEFIVSVTVILALCGIMMSLNIITKISQKLILEAEYIIEDVNEIK